MSNDDYDLKQCARCGGLIPTSATMCSQCGSSSVDGPDGPIAAPAGAGAAAVPGLGAFAGRRGIDLTKLLIGVNIAFYVFSLLVQARVSLSGGILPHLLGGPGWQAFDLAGWYFEPHVRGGEYWRLLSATFLHGGLLHIAFNLYALASLGRAAESLFGPRRYLVVYLACALASTLTIGWWQTFQGARPTPAVGASGAIFGLLGVLAVFLKRKGNRRGRAIARSLVINAVILLAIGWYLDFVSNAAHVGGLVCGGLFGLFMGDEFAGRLRPDIERRWGVAAAILCSAAALSLVFAIHNALTGPIPR